MVMLQDFRQDVRQRLVPVPLPAGVAGAGSLPALTRWLTTVIDKEPPGLVITVTGQPAEPTGPVGPADVTQWTRWEKAVRRLERLRVVTAAAVDGPVEGPVFGMLLALDHVVVTPRTVLTCRDVREGQLPGMVLHRLAKYVGLGHAKRLVLTGEALPAGEALRLGLASELSADPLSAVLDRLGSLTDDQVRSWHLSRRLLIESYATSAEDAIGAVLAAQERALREHSRSTCEESP